MTEKKNGMSSADVEMISKMLDENLAKIRQLNDDLRIRRLGGAIFITAGHRRAWRICRPADHRCYDDFRCFHAGE